MAYFIPKMKKLSSEEIFPVLRSLYFLTSETSASHAVGGARCFFLFLKQAIENKPQMFNTIASP